MTARCIQALQEHQSSPPTPLASDAETLFRLIQLRSELDVASHNGPLHVYTQSPRGIATTFFDLPGPAFMMRGSYMPVVKHCVDILEEPANTGVTHYIRSRVSCWGLEQLVLVFESALLLCSWMRHVASEKRVDQGASTLIVGNTRGSRLTSGTDDQRLMRRVERLLPLAWSSLDEARSLPQNPGTRDLAVALVEFWARVLGASDNKPFTRLLGEALSEYRGMMAR